MVKVSHIYSIIFILLVHGFSYSDTHYVSLDGTNDATGGYTDWVGAATQIQWAVTKAVANDTVLVSNGTYVLTNQISISKVITLKSLNGCDATFINGNYPNTTNRCIFASGASSADGPTIDGFTITNGFAHTDIYGATAVGGGGIYCQLGVRIINCTIALNQSHLNSSWTLNGGGALLTYGSSISNCIISNNVAVTSGRGGGLAGTGESVYNSLIISNSSSFRGGGAYGVTLYNCTLVSNTATTAGGGVYLCTLVNCISWKNNVVDAGGSESYSCGVGYTGTGSITNDPLFIGGGNYRLNANSPCINRGINQSWMTGTFDLDGKQRIRYGAVDMGAYEKIYEGTVYKFH